jgi:hypothetical protein
MKHTEEEKNRAKFFRDMNLLTERFFGKNDLDLDQLQELAQYGKINPVVNVVNVEQPFKIINEAILKGQKVFIIQLQVDVKNFNLYSLFKKEFVPINSFEDENNAFFKDFIEKEIVLNTAIYSKRKIGLKNFRLPKVFGYGEYSNTGEPFFMEYKFPIQYSHVPKVTAFVKVYWSKTSPRNLRGVPSNIKEGTIIVVGKKE